MKKRIQSVVMAALMLIMSLNVFAPAVHAAEVLSVEIPVSVALSGEIPEEAEEFLIKWKAEDSLSPMPEGSVDGVYTVKTTGEGEVEIPAMVYSKVGIYSYTVWQEPGTSELGHYDSTVYNVKVYVTNAEDGSGLEYTILAYLEDESKKLDEIQFSNTYDAPPTEEPEPSEEEIPEETPEEIPAETPGKLIQTGQMNWPVPVLITLGAMILILGIALLRKRDDNA